MEDTENKEFELREDDPKPTPEPEPILIVSAAKAMSLLGSSKGGKARAAKLSPEERSEIARNAVRARWKKSNSADVAHVPPTSEKPLPVASWKGMLNITDVELPCYVLDNGQRVIGRVSFTEMLSGFKYQGDLEGYIRSRNLQPYINKDAVVARMISFRLPEVEQLGRDVKGLPTDLIIDVCQSLMKALEASYRDEVKLTPRQQSMAIKASMFLSACAKVGLDALVDEATGYQYKREEDALQVKLRAYLAEEMRKWERTFPEELWYEFARLTNWKGSVTRRPKYWGNLVMKLVYEYLDPDVAKWLKDNAPKPQKGQNYHQWLSAQFGLRKLVEHIWMVIGISKTCPDGQLGELEAKMRQMFGRGVQLSLFLPMPSNPHRSRESGNSQSLIASPKPITEDVFTEDQVSDEIEEEPTE